MGELLENKQINLSFEVEKKEDGQIGIKNYDEIVERIKKYVEANQPFIINNNQDCKLAREIRANYNKFLKLIKEYRITFVETQLGLFQTQCKEIETIFDLAQKEFGKYINDYNGKLKEEKTIITLIYQPNEKIDKDISELCIKYPTIILKREK